MPDLYGSGLASVGYRHDQEGGGIHRYPESPIDWTVTLVTAGVWRFDWDIVADDTLYEIWLNGTMIASTRLGTYTFNIEGYIEAPPPLEIYEEWAGKAENREYPPFAVIQWRGIAEAAGYVVEQKIGGSWRTAKHLQERGKGYYAYRTDVLDDDTAIDFRITALDNKGTEGTPIEFTCRVIRNPPPPEVSYVVVGGNLVMEEA